MHFEKPLDFSNKPILIVQLLSYASMVYFSYRSVKVIRKGLKEEHSEQGSLPVLAFAYMVFTLIFTVSFISQFSTFYDLNTKALIKGLTFTDDIKFYLFLFNAFIISILLAFTFNFSKSFFTMNSLEFGIIVGKKYGSVFQDKIGRSLKFDIIIRFIIAVLFVMLEHTLSESFQFLKVDGLSFFTTIGVMAGLLYLSTLLWVFTFRSKARRRFATIEDLQKKTNKEKDKGTKVKLNALIKDITEITNLVNSRWFGISVWQYISGLVLSFCMIVIGLFHDLVNYKIIGIAISSLIILTSVSVILSIILNGKNGNNSA